MRLRRSNLRKPGYARRRRGKGFAYLDADGGPLRDAEQRRRIKELVIPPAWSEVWICTDPRGHIQATGVDVAGRKQYLYHPAWREARDQEKFEHVRELAGRLPRMRDRLCADLTGTRGLCRERVLAAVVRLLDLGMFRVGSDRYAARDDDPSYGLSTLRPDHVLGRGGGVVLKFRGKSGVDIERAVEDPEVCVVLRDLKRRRRGEPRVFAFWNASARRWQDVHADDINDYLREISGKEMTAKDFRTWHGTVAAAASLAQAGPQPTGAKRKRAVSHAMKDVSELLGNTPAVARASYVDPRVLQKYERGDVIPTAPAKRERAVRKLLE